MSLDDFKTESNRSSNNQYTEKDSYIDGGSIIRTEQGATKACVELFELDEFEGWPTVEQWDTYKSNIGVTTGARHLKRQCGCTFNEIKELAGSEDINRSSVDKRVAYIHMLKAAIKYGDDFKKQDIIEDEDLISPSTVERITYMTFNECKRFLNLELNHQKDISVDKVKEELERLVDERGYPITMDKVDSICSFSYHTVERFGNGDYTDGLENLGFNVTPSQQYSQEAHSGDSSIGYKASSMLSGVDSYDEKAYGHIYVLKLEHQDIPNAVIYVGQSISINRRLQSHILEGGHFNHPLPSKNGITHSDKLSFNIEMLEVDNVYLDEYENIKQGLRHLEQLKQNEICRRYPDSIVVGK